MPDLDTEPDVATPAANPPMAEKLRTAVDRLNSQQKAVMAIALAGVLALVVWGLLMVRQPDYRVLFSNLGERDGGAIIAAIEQLNVPYKFTEGSGAIQVPSSRVHEIRLRLASQGLPKGGNVGFELMENPKFGVSQFAEQVTYQRALEGELARTIQSIAAVQSARVHLAIPKPSVFVREEQKPTASVLLNLYPGRPLEPSQVSGIAHLVASSVPQLATSNVSIIDQNGRLVSSLKSKLAESGLDPAQSKYITEVQDEIARRIEGIVAPIVGQKNVRVQVAADIDFSQTEQTAETYRPNTQTIRSQHVTETANINNQGLAGGVPGALSNQPPVPATATLATAPAGTAAANKTPPNSYGFQTQAGEFNVAGVNSQIPALGQPPLSSRKDSTVNFEIDKTVLHTKQGIGTLKRVSAAVVINQRREGQKQQGNSDEEMKQINGLVKEAMGFNTERGDSLSVVSAPFAPSHTEETTAPAWRDPDMLSMVKEIFWYLALLVILALIFFKIVRPLLGMMFPSLEETASAATVAGGALTEPGLRGRPRDQDGGQEDNRDHTSTRETAGSEGLSEREVYDRKVSTARDTAMSDPKAVANIVRGWMGNENG